MLPNSTYGYGRINALKAVKQALDFRVATRDLTDINDGLTIYPNPFKDNINIGFIGVDKTKIKVYDLVGNTVFNSTISNESSLNLGFLNPGFYTLVAEINGTKIIKKIVKY